MENTMKMYVTADEAAQILGVSRGSERWPARKNRNIPRTHGKAGHLLQSCK